MEIRSKNSVALIQWSPEYQTGNPEIDSHHIALINQLYHALMPRVETAKKLFETSFFLKKKNYLRDYLLEGLFLEGHRANHDKFISDLTTFFASTTYCHDHLAFWYFTSPVAQFIDENHLRTLLCVRNLAKAEGAIVA